MISLIKYLSNQRDNLTTLEAKVLDFIIANPERVLNLSINQFANLIYCSSATISRTCKKLGYSGFTELKYDLNHLNEKIYQNSENINLDANLMNYLNNLKKELTLNLEIIRDTDFDKIVELLNQSDHVELFGIGRSISICHEAARKLTFAGRISTARTDWDELRLLTYYLEPKDLAIFISISGETIQLLEYANELNNKNVKTLAIIGKENSSLEKIVDNTICLKIKNTKYYNIDLSSNYIFSIFLDILVMKFLSTNNLNN